MAAAFGARFRYQNLPEGDCIRLLRLRGPDTGPDFSFVLEVYSLHNAPPYQALSYTWGDARNKRPITVNNATFLVTENLFSFFEHRGLKGKLLWVDAICINQDDDREKSHQVKRMTMIYEMADHVVVWLGPPGHRTDWAMVVLEDIALKKATESPRPNSTLAGGLHISRELLDGTDKDIKALSEKGSALWSGAMDLANRPWWRRAWILQEATTKQPTAVTCGYTGMYMNMWLKVSEILEILAARSPQEGLKELSLAFRRVSDPIFFIMTGRSLSGNIFRSMGFVMFLELLKLMQGREATDPRDLVFSILGIYGGIPASLTLGGASFPVTIEADYSQTKELCYQKLGKVTILMLSLIKETSSGRQDNNFGHCYDMLAFCSPTPPGLIRLVANWIPDWRFKGKAEILPQRRRTMAFTDPPAYFASGRSATAIEEICRNAFSYEVSDTTWKTHGIILDSIAVTKRRMGDVFDIEVVRSWGNDESCYRAYPATGETQWDAYAKTIVADFGPVNGGERGFTFDWSLLGTFSDPGKEAEYIKTLEARCFGRVLARTVKGYLALVPEEAQGGDVLVNLCGGQCFHVFRPCGGNNFGFVGESYVHGFMDGELVDMARNGLQRVRDIHII